MVLAVDGGNTKTVAAVATLEGHVRGCARGGPSDIYGTGSVEAGFGELAATVGRALDEAGAEPAAVTASAFSLAGADWPEDHDLLTSLAAERLGVRDPLVVNDALGGLRAGTAAWEGMAVVCGTFNAVGARNRDGRVFHLGFWPDRTGAYDLSVNALKAVYRAGLGLGPATALTERALALYGADDPLALLHHFTRRGHPGAGEVVRMAPVLLDVADAGDPVARALVREAGTVLGDEARVSAERVGLPLAGTPVVLSGGVFEHPSTLLAGAIMERLPGACAVRNGYPPIVGALLLALDRAGRSVDPAVLASRLAV